MRLAVGGCATLVQTWMSIDGVVSSRPVPEAEPPPAEAPFDTDNCVVIQLVIPWLPGSVCRRIDTKPTPRPDP